MSFMGRDRRPLSFGANFLTQRTQRNAAPQSDNRTERGIHSAASGGWALRPQKALPLRNEFRAPKSSRPEKIWINNSAECGFALCDLYVLCVKKQPSTAAVVS
jgi:hypothetical protein